MQKYKVSIPVVLVADVDAIAVRFPKSFKADSVKAKVLLTAGKPRALARPTKGTKNLPGIAKMDLEGVVEPPFSETAEHLAI